MKYGKKWQAFFEIFQVEWEPCNISDKTRVQELVQKKYFGRPENDQIVQIKGTEAANILSKAANDIFNIHFQIALLIFNFKVFLKHLKIPLLKLICRYLLFIIL